MRSLSLLLLVVVLCLLSVEGKILRVPSGKVVRIPKGSTTETLETSYEAWEDRKFDEPVLIAPIQHRE